MNPTFRRLWLGQLISNLGTQCSLYGIGLWSFKQRGELLGFAAVAFVVQLAKVLVLPLLGQHLGSWPRPRPKTSWRPWPRCSNGASKS